MEKPVKTFEALVADLPITVTLYVTRFDGRHVQDVFEGPARRTEIKAMVEWLGLSLLNYHQDNSASFSGECVVMEDEHDSDNYDVFLVVENVFDDDLRALGVSDEELASTDKAVEALITGSVSVAAALRRATRWKRYHARRRYEEKRWAHSMRNYMSSVEWESRLEGAARGAAHFHSEADELESYLSGARDVWLRLCSPGEYCKGERSWDVLVNGECAGSIREQFTDGVDEDHPCLDVVFYGEDSLGGSLEESYANRWILAVDIVASYRKEVRANTERARRAGLVRRH